MLESFLITSRETLEASLVIGIVMAYLNRTNNRNYKKNVYYGIALGIIISILAAFVFTFIAGEFKGASEVAFEGITMLLGAFLLTTMILWMMQQRHVSKEIEGKVQKHLTKVKPLLSHFGIFLLVFVVVIREGIETVIFLNATNYASKISFVSGILGIIIAIIIGYLLFMSVKKINLKRLFNVSSVLLILFAAGLVLHGVHEFVEAKILPGIISPLFDVSNVLSDESIFGSLLKGLFGYVSNPSLLEIISYIAYLTLILYLYKRIKKSKVNSHTN